MTNVVVSLLSSPTTFRLATFARFIMIYYFFRHISFLNSWYENIIFSFLNSWYDRRKETSQNKKLHACLLFKVAILKCSGDMLQMASLRLFCSLEFAQVDCFSRAVALKKQPSTFGKLSWAKSASACLCNISRTFHDRYFKEQACK